MNLFAQLFGRKPAPPKKVESANVTRSRQPGVHPAKSSGVILWRPGSYPLKVVGESNYQEALIAIFGRYSRIGADHACRAVIELEPTNPYDANAVVVKIEGRKVGYLPREQAARISAQMRADGIAFAACEARIRGGWRTNQHDEGMYGVSLGIPTRDRINFGIGNAPRHQEPLATAPEKSR